MLGKIVNNTVLVTFLVIDTFDSKIYGKLFFDLLDEITRVCVVNKSENN